MSEQGVESPTQNKKSDWIRRSVLFWSSQNNSRYDLTESPMPDDVILENRPESPLPLDESNATGELINNGRLTPGSNCSAVSSEKYDSLSMNETNQDSYNTEKLKQQIANFHERLKRYASIASFISDDTSESIITSPHLTLEFPRGSSITKNPIYLKVNNLNGNDNVDTLSISCDEGKQNIFDKRSNQFDISTESRLSSRAEHEKIESSIRLVQETLEEIAKTINNKDMKRDPNEVLLNLLLKIKPPEQSFDEFSISQSQSRLNSRCECLHAGEEDISDRHERLLKNVDNMLNDDLNKYDGKTLTNNQQIESDENLRGRHDSGLHSNSSDSNSPFPSPSNRRVCRPRHAHEEYDSGFSDMTQLTNAASDLVKRVSETNVESEKFCLNCDDDTDWSPISTLSSVYTSRASTMERMRSNSVPRMGVLTSQSKLRRFSATKLDEIEMRESLEKTEAMYSENELQAIRKFLTLTSQYFERNANKSESWLQDNDSDSVSALPSIKEAIEIQKRELDEQRRKLEEFLHQLGDMLVEIVSLKEEHNLVRTKQAKALGLLKKQLDIQKKHQHKAHNDVLSQVSSLKERIDQSTEYLPQSPRFSVPSSPSNSIIHSSSASGQLIWKVKDVMKRLARIKSGTHEEILVSQPFHTSEYGYKLNAWLYLNGRGKMTNKYISIYVSVIVGEYDPILSWPIKPMYKFMLLDQRSNSKKRQDHVRVRRVMDIACKGENIIAKHKGIPKPSDGSKALIVGFDDFIEHRNLTDSAYLVDDTLFMKIEARIDD